MATTAPTLVPSASSRRKGGKRPSPPESANGPPSIPENEMDLAKKIKLEPEDVALNASVKVKKEPEESPNDLSIPLMPAGNPKKPRATVSAFDWTSEDLTQLVANLSTCLPKADNVKYSTLIEKLDWEKVRFASFTAAQCKEKWIQIMTRLRRFRTLTDMVTDAREWLKHPWSSYTNSKKQKHPEMPKKPLTPYFRYFLEKREKYSRENPDNSMTDLAKLLSKKFQQLPEKKKQKYKESYEREIEVYRQELEKFKRDHPEEFPVLEAKHPLAAQEGPFKPLTPFQLFQGDRAKRPEYLEVDKKVFAERIRKQWTSLSDGKRIKWIRKAVQDELRYGAELMQYCEGNPNFKAERVKTVLSKAEKELKDRYDGKPDKPPNSGYSMFSKIMLRELKDVPAKEKMTEISRRWKLLSEADRDAYNKQVQKANVKYKEKYAAYLSSLVDEERQKAENEAKAIFAKKVENGNEKPSEKKELETRNGLVLGDGDGLNNRPKKPSSAMFFYQQEKYPIFHQKYPGLSKQELMRLMAREFSELSDKKKEKYRRLAEEERKKTEDRNKSSKPKSEGQVETPSGRKKLFKGEPRKPAQSGYGIFSTEMLSNLTEIDPKNRMAEIAKRWRVMPPPEKEKYKKKAQDLMKKYNKDHNKFLSTLTEEEMKEYQELRTKGMKKPTAKTAATKATAPDKVVKEEKKESESESSDGDEDDDGSSDDEDDSDQSDNDGDDSGSGSEESGSDSDDDDDSDDEKKEGKNESSSADTDSDSDSGSSDDSSDSGSESEEQ